MANSDETGMTRPVGNAGPDQITQQQIHPNTGASVVGSSERTKDPIDRLLPFEVEGDWR